jgi:uncharacterized membrane protein YbhN (UPF0104 family)
VPDEGRKRRRFSSWILLRRLLTIALAVVVIALLVHWARTVKWADVLAALQNYPMSTLAAAVGIAVLSHLMYSTYDLIGRHQTGHPLRTHQVLGVAFVSYAFNLNLGSLVGGFAMRYQLYARLGLSTPVITQVLGLSLLTNWLGYAFVAGTAFALSPPELPASWALGGVGLRALGGALVAVVFGYVGLCFAARRREWTIRGHRVVLPSGAVALWQLGVSVANWALIAGVVYVLMQQHVAYASVLCVLLIAAIAGVITHVPAGLGVIEAVFIALLSGQVPQAELIAALLAYRAIYYLAPLGIAVALLFALEVRGSRGSRRACESAADTDRHTGRRSIANSSYTR